MDTVSSTHSPSDRSRYGSAGLPAEAPVEMSQQSLSTSPLSASRLPTTPSTVWLRRVLVLSATVALTLAAAWQMYLVVTGNGQTALQSIILVLYAVLFSWIAFSFVTMLLGFVLQVFGRSQELGIDIGSPLPEIKTRCALLVPTYNETPERLMARIQAIYESIEHINRIEHFDVYILSDTTDPEIWIKEERQFLLVRERTGGYGRIFYRHRRINVGRKAGNIAEWARRFGGAYAFMVVLDADSLLTGDTIVRLVDAMERHPTVGLIQTLPIVVNADTLFSRLQQFAGRLYGPLAAKGMTWWHGSEGNYWGHNAIIRLNAFATSAGLPRLKGRRPFGGDIMSHDFVEAALLRRRGWGVHLVPYLGGSFEECPPSLDDYVKRDRRWCQGNLQHIKVLSAKGLHWVSRLHLLTGIGAYITAPLWLAFLLVGMLISLQAKFVRPEYFSPNFSLFPKWPVQDPVRSAGVFAATMFILLFPKILGLVGLLMSRGQRQLSGGGPRIILSALIETLISSLQAPVVMWTQSVAVFEILLGRDAGWSVQRREATAMSTALMLRRFAGPTILGVLLAGLAYAVSLPLFLWMSPVIVSLLLAVPLASLTSSAWVGCALRRLGLLVVPEEREEPSILFRANQLVSTYQVREEPYSAWKDLFTDSTFFGFHENMLPMPLASRRGEVDVALVVGLAKLDQCDRLQDALETLTKTERMAVLGNRLALGRLKQISIDELG